MIIGRSVRTLISAHSALKTGVHAVSTAFLAKTSQLDQTLGDSEIPAAIARDTEVAFAVGAEAEAREEADTTHAGLPNVHHEAITPAEVAGLISGSRITGNYTGNQTVRQITTGFKCSMVIILIAGVSDYYLAVLIPNLALAIKSAASSDRTAATHLHATDGFTLGDNSVLDMNTTDKVYYYWAISE